MANRFEQAAGGIIFADGIGSIIFSTDQRSLSNIGRVIRMAIGVGLVVDGDRR